MTFFYSCGKNVSGFNENQILPTIYPGYGKFVTGWGWRFQMAPTPKKNTLYGTQSKQHFTAARCI